jgi:hypothetical protein
MEEGEKETKEAKEDGGWGDLETKEAGNQVVQTGWRVVIRLCVAVSRLRSEV